MIGDESWFLEGIFNLAMQIQRHEKSVRNALDILEEKKMIFVDRNDNRIRIKLTLSSDELYTRIAFIDQFICNFESLQELRKDLLKDIAQLEREIEITKDDLEERERQVSSIVSILPKISDNDIDNLLFNIIEKRTFANINKSPDEIIDDALQSFRVEMYEKYSQVVENKISKKQGINEECFSRSKVEDIKH